MYMLIEKVKKKYYNKPEHYNTYRCFRKGQETQEGQEFLEALLHPEVPEALESQVIQAFHGSNPGIPGGPETEWMHSTSRLVSSPLREHTARLRCRREVGVAVVVVPAPVDEPFLSSLFLLDDDDDDEEEGRDLDLDDFWRVSERSNVGMSSSGFDTQRKLGTTSWSATSDFDERRVTTVEQRKRSNSDDRMIDNGLSISAQLSDC